MPLKTYACPHFGQGAEALDGQVTMKDAFGKPKKLECAKWREQECDMCHRDDEKEKSEREPRDLHERGRTGGQR